MNRFGGNVSFKEKYLQELGRNYSTSSVRNTNLLFRNARHYEELYQKDLYEFRWTEVLSMLTSLKIKTKNSLKARISMYSKYVDRAVEEGFANENGFERILPEQYSDIIDKNAFDNRYITSKDLSNNLAEIINAQDQVIFALLFDGAMGRNYECLTNLKISDINFATGKARLCDGSVVQLTEDTLYVIDEAINERVYYTGKDKMPELPIKGNDFIIRAAKRPKGTDQLPISSNGLRTRIDRYKKEMGLELLTGRGTYLSGVAQRAIEDGLMSNSVKNLDTWLKERNVATNANELTGIMSLLYEKLKLEQDEKESGLAVLTKI